MSLCAKCRDIPFGSLPGPYASKSHIRIVDHPELMITIFAPDEVAGEFGHVWHENIAALAQSAATGCPICVMMQHPVDNAFKYVREACETSDFWKEYIKDYQNIPEDQNLLLTKRSMCNDGFVVHIPTGPVPKGKHGRSGYLLLGAVGYGSLSADALDSGVVSEGFSSLPLLAKPLHPDSGSLHCLEMVSAWISDCANKHARCSGDDSLMPTRILDVGKSGEPIKLIEPPQGTFGRYASLSYCWGKSLPFTTTRETYEARRSGVDLADLPKTFQDAVLITRHLGIQYLWIDSLCIFQDDLQDWARESARMLNIYTGAYIVISAARASDSNEGCFHSRAERPGAEIDVPELGRVNARFLYATDAYDIFDPGFDDEPLSTRGWALQERVLAKRSIHYNSRQMYFECDHGVVSEDGCINAHRYCELNKLGGPSSSYSDCQTAWNQLLWNFGHRSLTKPTDKLPSMGGLAAHFADRLGGEYVAGLWSSLFVQELAWQGLRRKGKASATATEYTGPSWSWASFDGIAASTILGSTWEDLAEVLEWRADLKDAGNPYGEVDNAWVRVHGPVADLLHEEMADGEHEVRMKRAGLRPVPRFSTKYRHDGDVEEVSQVMLDDTETSTSEKWHSCPFKVILLGYPNISLQRVLDLEPKPKNSTAYGLVVASLPSGNGYTLQRVGCMFINGQELVKFVDDKTSWQSLQIY